MWCIPTIDEEYEKRMMDILSTYERPHDPQRPVVCLDEKSKQLISENRPSIKAKQGSIKKRDYEYVRRGTLNLFVATEPLGKRRHVVTTKRRTKKDFAQMIKTLTEVIYPHAKKIILVTDNLNTHTPQSIIETFGETIGNNIVEKLEWHYTPKHASWLNMAEIEIQALSTQCLKQPTDTFQKMQKKVGAWQKDRNKKQIGINWQFTQEKARKKFKLPIKILL